MPLLGLEMNAELLRAAQTEYWHGLSVYACLNCRHHIVKDYCRTCDEFYFIHGPDCRWREWKHDGHRTALTPFVEAR
jgi:hypothetical protein